MYHKLRPQKTSDSLSILTAGYNSAVLGSFCIFILCMLIEFVISPTNVNMTISFIAMLVGCLSFLYCFRVSVFPLFPISTLMIAGLSGTVSWGALLVQALSFRALDFNLQVPLATFILSAAVVTLAILAHMLYRSSVLTLQLQKLFQINVLSKLQLLSTPSFGQLWIMGFVGLAAIFFFGNSAADNTIEFGDVSGKFGLALQPFSVAPFLIPVCSHLFGGQRMSPKGWLPLAAYFTLMVAGAIIANSRGIFAYLIFILFLSFIVIMGTGGLKVSRGQLKAGVLIGILGLSVYPMLSDLSVAMIIAREKRTNLSAAEMFEETLSILGRPEAIEAHKSADTIIDDGYNEIYIKNLFLARLVQTKYIDLNLANAKNLTGSYIITAQDTFRNRLIAYLPMPVMKFLGFDLEKEDIQYSGGDLYAMLAGLGDIRSFAIGNAVVDGMVIFGPFVWPLIFLIYYMNFFLFDATTFRRATGHIFISPMAIIILPALLLGALASRIFPGGLLPENFSVYIAVFVRSYPQFAFLYFILFVLSHWLCELSEIMFSFHYMKRFNNSK